jgi:hypothetical protein
MDSPAHHGPGGPEDPGPWDETGPPCRVIAVTHHGEIHGYLISRTDERGRVAWRTASGRVRYLLARPADLHLPSGERPWEGLEIPWLLASRPTARPRSA